MASRTSSTPEQHHVCCGVRKPSRLSASSRPDCESIVGPPMISPLPYRTMSRGRLATSAESSCLSEPAVALRGLAKRGSPASARSRLSCAKPERVMITSPRTSSTPGASAWPSALSRSGMVRMVRRLAVTSSPAMPSPRVVPRVNRPSSKRRLIATPSALGSTSHSSGSPGRSFCTRSTKSRTSSCE